MGKKGDEVKLEDESKILEDEQENKPEDVLKHVMKEDYHEGLMGQIRDAVDTQMKARVKSKRAPHYQRPEMVLTYLVATTQTVASIDPGKNTSTVTSGLLIGEDEQFLAPTELGIGVVAEAFHNTVHKSSLRLESGSTGVHSADLQRALPELVNNTIEEAVKAGEKAYKRLEKEQENTNPTWHTFIGQPGESRRFMTVVDDPNKLETQQRMINALGTIRARVEALEPQIAEVKVEIVHTKTFQGVYGSFFEKFGNGSIEDRLSHVESVTKDSSVAVTISAKKKNGVSGEVFEACTGGLEGLGYSYLDTNSGKVINVKGFDEVVEALADATARKVRERDTSDTITGTLGNDAPVVLSPQAAAFLVHAITMYSSGSIMVDQMKEGSKDLASKLGTSVLPSSVNIEVNGRQHPEDDGHKKNRYGSMEVDAEGTPVKPLKIITGGRMANFMASRTSLLPVLQEHPARIRRKKIDETEMGRGIYEYTVKGEDGKENPAPLHGMARVKGYSSAPVVAPTNIDLSPDPNGPTELSEIVKKAGKSHDSLYVDSVDGVSFDSDGNIALEVDLAYLISGGNLNTHTKFSAGKVFLKYEKLKDNILAISGEGTQICTPLDAQVAAGQAMRVSVSSPAIVLANCDFSARGRYGTNEFQNYVDDMGERGSLALADKLYAERQAGLLQTGGVKFFGAVFNMAGIKQRVVSHDKYDLDTAGPPAEYKLGDDGSLKEV